jgi:hydrogenase nickel incorporation protein HypA/HybF
VTEKTRQRRFGRRSGSLQFPLEIKQQTDTMSQHFEGRGKQVLMHELPITESILKIVLKHAAKNGAAKVVTIRMSVGQLSDLQDEWIQHYFDYLSKGTAAEGAKLAIERPPARVRCDACSNAYEVRTARIAEITCPECGQKGGTLLSGREYYIKEMEVQ